MSAEGPSFRNVPGLGDVLADGWVEVLEIAAKAFCREGGPGNELVHAVGVFVPCMSKISILSSIGGEQELKEGELTIRVLRHQTLQRRWQLLNSARVLKEQYGTIRSLEALNLIFIIGEDCRGHGFLCALHADIPQLVVLVAEEDDGAAGLDVEGGGGVFDGVVDDHDDTVIGDGRFL